MRKIQGKWSKIMIFSAVFAENQNAKAFPGPREPRKPHKSIEHNQNEKRYWGILEKMLQTIFGAILAENRWFWAFSRAWFEISPAFPEIFRRKMGAGNMKNGGASTSSFQNTQKFHRSIKTRKVIAIKPSVRPNWLDSQISSSTNINSYSRGNNIFWVN